MANHHFENQKFTWMNCSKIQRMKSILILPQRTCTMIAILVTLAVSLIVEESISNANAQDPPQYLVTSMENIQGETFRPTDINNAGLVTLGKYSNPHLFVDVPNTPGLMYDINNLPDAMWIDLKTGDMWDQATTPWIADGATGINESNQIVGTAYVPNGPDRVYVLENPLGTNPVFKLLPGFGNGVRGNAINADGVVVGTAEGQIVVFDPRTDPNPYAPVGISAPVDLTGGLSEAQEINVHGDIVTPTGHIVSPAGYLLDGSFNYEQASVYYYDGYLFYGINDSRQICGSRPSTGRGRNQQSGGTVRFQYDPDATSEGDRLVVDALIGDSTAPHFCDVNEFGDVAFDNNRAYVYLESPETPGLYALDQHVVFASPDDEAKWMASARAQPNGINDLGQIIVRGDGQLGFFLTPIAPVDPGPTLSVNDVTMDEGSDGSTTIGHFTITLSGDIGGTVMVSYAIIDGSATVADSDYSTNLESDVLSFSPGETSKEVEFTIIGDNTKEPDETFLIQLGEAVGGATVIKGQGTATIKNDDKKGGRR